MLILDRPLLLAFDDLQWTDQETFGLAPLSAVLYASSSVVSGRIRAFDGGGLQTPADIIALKPTKDGSIDGDRIGAAG